MPLPAAGTKPDVLLFALCGFDLKQSVQMAQEAAQKLAAAGSKSIPAIQRGRVAAVDGELDAVPWCSPVKDTCCFTCAAGIIHFWDCTQLLSIPLQP
jgi:hypothetical protein